MRSDDNFRRGRRLARKNFAQSGGFFGRRVPQTQGTWPGRGASGSPCCREARVKPPQKHVNRGSCTTLQPLVLAPDPRVGRSPASARTGERPNGRARATLRRSALKGRGKYFDPRRAPTLK